jgi:hypothetical protein
MQRQLTLQVAPVAQTLAPFAQVPWPVTQVLLAQMSVGSVQSPLLWQHSAFVAIQAPWHSCVSAGHWQLPSWQTLPAAQTLPQEPQLVSSV